MFKYSHNQIIFKTFLIASANFKYLLKSEILKVIIKIIILLIPLFFKQYI